MDDKKSLESLFSLLVSEKLPLWKMQQFRKERIYYQRENENLKVPLELVPGPRLIIHLISEKSIYDDVKINLKEAIKPENWLLPLGVIETATVEDFNFDGLIFTSTEHSKLAYTQLFRNGIVEMVNTVSQGNDISLLKMQQEISTALKSYLKILATLGVSSPFHVYTYLLNVRNLKLEDEDVKRSGYEEKGRNKAFIRNEVGFPERLIVDQNINEQFLYPTFDILWNIFGFIEAPRKLLQ